MGGICIDMLVCGPRLTEAILDALMLVYSVSIAWARLDLADSAVYSPDSDVPSQLASPSPSI